MPKDDGFQWDYGRFAWDNGRSVDEVLEEFSYEEHQAWLIQQMTKSLGIPSALLYGADTNYSGAQILDRHRQPPGTAIILHPSRR